MLSFNYILKGRPLLRKSLFSPIFENEYSLTVRHYQRVKKVFGILRTYA